jgi:AcrR family transcriptional regulator
VAQEQDRRQGGQLDRRQAVVEAAFRCLAERGFEGLRLRIVAADAGIDHSTLHHYFATKEDLVAAVLDDVTRQFWVTLPNDGTAAERLHHHLRTVGRLIRHQPALFTVLVEFDLRGHRDEVVRRVIEQDEAGWRGALTDVWQQGVEQHAWAVDLEAVAAVELIIAVIKGVRLLPRDAESVLAQFERTLTGRSTADLPHLD